MKNEDYEKLCPRVKELRIQMDLTQAQVASALNVTPGYISNVENNRTAMSLRVLIYYAKLMHISLDSLIGRIDSDYRGTALDHEIMDVLSTMDEDKKLKLLRTLKIWNE